EPDNDGCFAWDANIMCPATTFKPGDTLTGTFESERSLLRQMPEGTRGVKNKTITFGPNNTYTQVGNWTFQAVSPSVDNTPPGVEISGGGEGAKEAGTIRIEPSWIDFQPAGAAPRRLLAIPITVYDGKRGKPDHLYIAGEWFI